MKIVYATNTCPKGLCDCAWRTMNQYVFALSSGVKKFYGDDWTNRDGIAVVTCNDGFRPPATPEALLLFGLLQPADPVGQGDQLHQDRPTADRKEGPAQYVYQCLRDAHIICGCQDTVATQEREQDPADQSGPGQDNDNLFNDGSFHDACVFGFQQI
ncbi:MAG: TIGR04076 family protein [Bacteroidales bacterium]|nr:TIGR04076 family protein [Bacteroidales bacterium]